MGTVETLKSKKRRTSLEGQHRNTCPAGIPFVSFFLMIMKYKDMSRNLLVLISGCHRGKSHDLIY